MCGLPSTGQLMTTFDRKHVQRWTVARSEQTESSNEKTHKSSNRAKCVGQTAAFVNGRSEDDKDGHSSSRWEEEIERRRRLTRHPISRIGPGHGNQINAQSPNKFVGCSSRDSEAIFLVIEPVGIDTAHRFRNHQTLTPNKTIKWPTAGVCSYHDNRLNFRNAVWK